MISIRKYMDDNKKESLLETSLAGWRNSLAAFFQSADHAVPGIGHELGKKLSAAAEKLTASSQAETISATSIAIEQELAIWAGKAHAHHVGIAQTIHEIIDTISHASNDGARRDDSYAQQIGVLNGQLYDIAALDDLPQVRRSILDSARALKSCVERLTEEGKESRRKLAREVAEYRARLAESEQISSIDPLTQLFNRRTFEHELARRMQTGQAFCLIMMDLNGFKAINDTHGHLAGDDLLNQFGSELKSQFRPADFVARWGGDEFVAILQASLPEAQTRTGQICHWVLGDYKIQSAGKTITVAIHSAIGIAEWDLHESATNLIARADATLYAHKSSRNTF